MSEARVQIKLGVSGQAQVAAAFSQIKGGAASLGSALKGMAAPLAALAGSAVALSSVAAGFKRIVDQGGKLADLSARTSVGVKSLIRWREVFEESGKSADSIGSTFDKAARSIYGAATAGGSAQLALAKLGVSAKELSTLSPEDQFEALAKAINGIANPMERSAIAMQIFGKSGSELLPVFDTMQNMASVDGALGRLPEVLGRNVKTLDAIGDSFTQLELKSKQFFAGIMDQVGSTLAPMLDAVTKIDLTGAGQSVGAFVNAAIDAWKEGRFGEFVALSIEAGFEQGAAMGRESFRKLSLAMGGGEFWAPVGAGLLTAVNEGLKSIASGITYLAVPFTAVFDYAMGYLSFAFESAADVLGDALRKVLNTSVDFLNEKLGTSFGGFTYNRLDPSRPSFSGAMDDNSAMRSAVMARFTTFLDNSTASARSLAGMSSGSGDSFDATAKLSALVGELKEKREASALAEASTVTSLAKQLPVASAVAGIREQEAESLRVIRRLEDERAAIAGSFALNEAQKWGKNLELLTAQREELQRMVRLLREQAALAGLSDQERTQISQRADSFDARLSGVTRQMEGLGPNPYSTPEQMEAAMTGLENQFGTTAQAIARSFTHVIGTAVDSVSDGIQKLIGDTQYWSQKLGNIAGPIMGAITQSISRMFTEWITKRALAAAKNIFFSTKEGTADAAAKAPGALMSSISSWGIAAGVGAAAFLAAMAISGGFREGGYTGDGSRNEIAGLVHRGEVVFEKPVVDRIGLNNLLALREGGASPASAMVPAGPSGSSVTIAAFDSRLDARRWAQSQEAEVWFADMARKTSNRWSRS